jgi:hypothetical protein
MTTVIAAATPDTPRGGVILAYEPDHHRQHATCLCWCGARATGRTLYYYRGRLVAIRDQCGDHLPTTAAAYTVVAS